MKLNNENLLIVNQINIGPVSLAASTSLKPMYVGSTVNYSIQLVFTGTPDGTFKLQASNDVGSPNPNAPNDPLSYQAVVNWTDIEDSDQDVSAAGNHMWDVQNIGYYWVRVVWTADTAGTAPLLTVARAVIKGA